MGRKGAWVILIALGTWVAGCEGPPPAPLSPTQTVKQVRPKAAEAGGDYRLVEMPESAKRNFIPADPSAAGAVAYSQTVRPR